jgi:2-polyprenyl-6-methoxyphenol hydroxylase-like FAD-dependent oxidoreductase/very-short-patch-repair endonuclease
MKINIIGGGPAGMYFAILMKKADASHDITVYERNGPDDTFGWGVVFSGKTLANLRAADQESHAEITKSFAAWDNVDVVHRQEKISIRGNSFSGIARLQLLKILQRRCEQLGIELLFRTEIADLELLRADCDLLVAADGVNSTARRQYAERFEPSLDFRPNRYIWYGTHQLFHGLTLTFRESDAGVFAAHSYKFNQTTSTFIIECDPQTWDTSGFAAMNDDETRQHLGKVFGRDLAGQPLLSNNSKWLNFLLVRNANWSFENVVLLGDALHTAHFSIGSGTKLALEDAIALFDCSRKKENVGAALDEFETTRKPVIEAYQAAAQDSMRWFENARDYMHLTPIELAYSLMTRSGRVSREDLAQRDPEFIRRYEREGTHCFAGGTLVRTNSGWTAIEVIEKDEFVWTHAGRVRAVVGTQCRPHVGRMIGLKLQNNNSFVWVTPEQKFLTPSPQAERGQGGEVGSGTSPTPYPTPPAGRGASIHRKLGGKNPGLAHLARDLRRNGTAAEIVLWEQLRNRRLRTAKFRRQHPLGPNYIVDFYCREFSLAIELDGSVHESDRSQWADGIRQRQIQGAGVRILRFRNEQIFENIEGVLTQIAEYLAPSPQAERGKVGEVDDASHPTPYPSPLAGRGTLWLRAECLVIGDRVILNESGDLGVVELVDQRFANGLVYDLTVAEDHSFITKAGVVHNSGRT